MREFKDRDWDRRYEDFKLRRERRRQIEPKVEKVAVSSRLNVGTQNYQKALGNRGPSRFLRDRMASNAPIPVQQPVMHVEQPRVQVVPMNDEVKQTDGWSLVDILPYIFIVAGIVLIILILTGVL